MSRLKRSSSSQLANLSSRVSEFHPSVTLYERVVEQDSPRRSKRIKREPKEENIEDLEDLIPMSVEDDQKPVKAESSSSAIQVSASTKKSPKKVKAIPQSLATPHPAPAKWRETYDTIKEMRSRIVAPVDSMGCDQAQHKETDPKNRRLATLVSLILSSQTKDEVTDVAVANLRAALGGSISLQAIIDAPESAISDAIAKVGFWRRKTTYLKQSAIMLRDKFDGDIPKTVDELCALPGVGPKMAFLTLQVAWDMFVIYDGIGVDVHVHRITNLLGWHKPPTKTPEETRLNLQSWLPKELYRDINHMLVGFGQVICPAVAPRCDECELSRKGLCPSARAVKSKNRTPIVFIKPEEAKPTLDIALEESPGDQKSDQNSIVKEEVAE
ncbi:DNA glycosylase [Panaeolus papilionaceus]|nr:DNA glycosylase [Panaeolus papilionaceus]